MSTLLREAADRIEEHRDCRGVAFLESELAAKDRRIAELEAKLSEARIYAERFDYRGPRPVWVRGILRIVAGTSGPVNQGISLVSIPPTPMRLI